MHNTLYFVCYACIVLLFLQNILNFVFYAFAKKFECGYNIVITYKGARK